MIGGIGNRASGQAAAACSGNAAHCGTLWMYVRYATCNVGTRAKLPLPRTERLRRAAASCRSHRVDPPKARVPRSL